MKSRTVFIARRHSDLLSFAIFFLKVVSKSSTFMLIQYRGYLFLNTTAVSPICQ